MFQNIAQNLTNTNIGGNSSAIIHLFSPRAFSNQSKRPINYNFNGKFVVDALDAVQYSANNGMNGIKIDTMLSNPCNMTTMVPSTMPDYTLNMDNFRYKWTFMLVVNNDKGTPQNSIRSMADNLQLYYGYFNEEPINPQMHLGKLTPNPNATLMVTHRTIINKSPFMSPTYGQGHRHDVVADVDIVPSRTFGYLADKPVKLIRPEDLYESFGSDFQGDLMTIHSEQDLLANREGHVAINSKLNLPKTNLKRVMEAISSTQATMQADSYSGRFTSLDVTAYDTLLHSNLQDTTQNINIGLSMNIILTFGHILSRYKPVVNRVNLAINPLYDQGNQSDGSAKNVFSSMLVNMIPPIMSDFMLANVIFKYDSYADKTMIGTRAFELEKYATIINLTPEETHSRIQSFIHVLKRDIFPILTMSRGDFNLYMNCDATSMSHVILNFRDDMMDTSVFEVPTLLGGLNTGLVSTVGTSDHNAKELRNLMQYLQEDDSTDKPANTFDQNTFHRALQLTHDNTTDHNQSLPQHLFPFTNSNYV